MYLLIIHWLRIQVPNWTLWVIDLNLKLFRSCASNIEQNCCQEVRLFHHAFFFTIGWKNNFCCHSSVTVWICQNLLQRATLPPHITPSKSPINFHWSLCATLTLTRPLKPVLFFQYYHSLFLIHCTCTSYCFNVLFAWLTLGLNNFRLT